MCRKELKDLEWVSLQYKRKPVFINYVMDEHYIRTME